MEMTQIWNRLDVLLKANNMSYDKLAQTLGISRNGLYNARTRGNSLRLETIIGICEYFEISTDWLLLGIEQEKPHKSELQEVLEKLQEPKKLKGLRLLLDLE